MNRRNFLKAVTAVAGLAATGKVLSEPANKFDGCY